MEDSSNFCMSIGRRGIVKQDCVFLLESGLVLFATLQVTICTSQKKVAFFKIRLNSYLVCGRMVTICGASTYLSRGHFVVLEFYLMCPFWIKGFVNQYFSIGVRFFSSPSHHPGLQVIHSMAASSSKARARPIPRDVSSSDESSHEILEDANIQPRQFSLLAPRLPRFHSIKRPFKLVLGGILVNPQRSRTRKTEFKLIERLPDIHPASRGVAAHTAGLFRSVRGLRV